MTVGTGIVRRSERISAPLRWTISALSFKTKTTARRDDTTHNGSKLAFSKSALATRVSPPDSRVYRRRCDRRRRWGAHDRHGSRERHHSKYETRSSGRGATVSPYAVSSRKRRYPASGTGRNGGRFHHRGRAIRAAWR